MKRLSFLVVFDVRDDIDPDEIRGGLEAALEDACDNDQITLYNEVQRWEVLTPEPTE